MSGLSNVLNIAKEALLTQQTAINIAGHNIANVNTEGYTRQRLDLTTHIPTQDRVGFIGNGVKAQEVSRLYDRFVTERIMNQESTLRNLDSQMKTMSTVEASFNEAPGLALNELMNEFWNSWQTLSNHPDNLAARQDVVQKGETVISRLHTMHSDLVQTRQEIGDEIEAAVSDVNTLTNRIADLNGRISSLEWESRQVNDLRDERDTLLKELSGLLDINYFETGNGAYTIMMKDGHSLVEGIDARSISWSENRINRITENADGVALEMPIASGEEIGGKIGGWMEVHNQLIPNEPENYMGRLDSLANSMIWEVNLMHTQGVGLVRFSDQLTGAAEAADTARLDAALDTAYATKDIEAGALSINGREIGTIEGGVITDGLAMIKAYNGAEAINTALTGARAKLTTLVAGDAVTGMAAAEDGNAIHFTVNGIDVNYTVDIAAGDDTPNTLATNIVNAINSALNNYNNDPATTPKMTIEAVVGDGTNGGAADSIVLRNTNPGDDSRIVIGDIETDSSAAAYITERKLGLTNGEYTPDASHNTGQIHIFSPEDPLEIDAGPNDSVLNQLGLGGGNHSASDEAGDGKLEYKFSDGGVANAINGLSYSEGIQRDGGSFRIWLYNRDNTPAPAQSVEVSVERAYRLSDVADAIETAIKNATGASSSWLNASVEDNRLVLTPDSEHKFAFGGDDSNFLAAAGLNTYFTGHDAGTSGTNELIADNLEYLAAGRIDDNGLIFPGDAANALSMSAIRDKEDISFKGGSDNTLDGHYNALIADIGMKSRSLERNHGFQQLVSDQLSELRDSTSGVSLDEEMANLIKFQHAYSAAAKLISSSDEMMQTLLDTI